MSAPHRECHNLLVINYGGSQHMVADAMAKAMKRNPVLKLMQDSWLKLTVK